MKTKLFSLLLISLIFMASCDKWIDTGLNDDPNTPKDAIIPVMLPTAEAGLSYVLGGDINRFTSLFTQYITGTDRQHQAIFYYNITEADIDNAWVTMYSGPLMDLYGIRNKSIEPGKASPRYRAIANVLMAFSLGTLTDIFGDIPYSECFQGAGNMTPKYESQDIIYSTIHELLDSAIILMGTAEVDNFILPGNDDFIFKGDSTSWVKAAHALKARFYMHEKKYNEALTELGNGFSGNSDDMQFVFGEAYTEGNPWFQFIDQRGDISMGGYLMNLMNSLNDPRRAGYAELDEDNLYSENSLIGTFYGSINSPVPFITYVEIKFIEAECKLANGDKPGAYSAYIEGITSSIQKIDPTADVATYLAQSNVGVGETNLSLQNIIEQKYIALYTQYESWTDWRRTGFPALTATVNIYQNKIIRRFIYPQSERLFNFGNLSKVPYYQGTPSNLFEKKMWWDLMW